ncbi:BrxE family protein [Shewanella algae]|uniref:BrxE family protein n=1 Tax=Shewanella algae TaxID=38313 RepID=UPI001C5990D9|nr:BrxE family protein [Shewanella algae]
MKKQDLKRILELRLLIGFLGEKAQFDWWGSAFLTKSSASYLMPMFPRTTLLAQYNGVCEAALKVHDEFIGIGQHYHLYRLPEVYEKALVSCISEYGADDVLVKMAATDSAIARLAEIAGSVDASEGPVNAGQFDEHAVEDSLSTIAGFYLAAFKVGKKSYPFLRSENA